MTETAMTRRAALGLIGGFATLTLGLAPILHDQTRLDVDITVQEASAQELVVELTNREVGFTPVWFTWDKTHKPRSNWNITTAPTPIPPNATVTYHLSPPHPSAGLEAGVTTQLTVYKSGTQHWESIQFTPGATI